MDANYELVRQVRDATGLSEAAVRSVLVRARMAGWHIVRFNPDAPETCWHLLIDEEWTP